ncbi:hypothetical protein WS90_11565 [Burkholderia cepacia]|uniref:Uncharacterized protein n=1 Tax=Burkholderia cepacia TaxID=292 RepID=A0A103ZR51_BURCE|nr:hypothetical protein WS90_11565 [Burkholderia cepacia]
MTPDGAYAEWHAAPFTWQRIASLPLWPSTGFSPVGSPIRHRRGRCARAASASSIGRTPRQPTSSSYENARCTGTPGGRATNAGTAASADAMKPFMSAVPRPYRRPSRSVSRNGSTVHACPSTGTTSV